MGLLISRFRRKPSTIELLEALEAKIQAIEKQGQWTDRRHKQVKARLLAVSVGICLICAVIVYLYKGRDGTWPETFFYGIALLFLPVILIFIGRLVSWYYSRNLKRNMINLNDMRTQKKKILEEVMDKETYKVAKQILDKFGGETLAKPQMAIKPFVPSQNLPATPGQLRQRQIAAVAAVMPPSSPVSSQLANLPALPKLTMNIKKAELPRPLTSINRSALDKIVDFLVSDGPTNRYALICKECHHHNGMALAEEFEYLSYHCAYCNKFNPSVKQRPPAPLALSPKDSDSDSSDTAAEITPRCQTPEKSQSLSDSKTIRPVTPDGDSKKQD